MKPYETLWNPVKPCEKWDILHINGWSPDFWTINSSGFHQSYDKSRSSKHLPKIQPFTGTHWTNFPYILLHIRIQKKKTAPAGLREKEFLDPWPPESFKGYETNQLVLLFNSLIPSKVPGLLMELYPSSPTLFTHFVVPKEPNSLKICPSWSVQIWPQQRHTERVDWINHESNWV